LSHGNALSRHSFAQPAPRVIFERLYMGVLMTRCESFLTALHGGRPDRVPLFDFLFQQPMYERLIGRRPEAYNGPDAVRLALALDHDGVWLSFGRFQGYRPEFLSENVYRDEYSGKVYKNE
jgi:uroporphyrinogen decarboxylase